MDGKEGFLREVTREGQKETCPQRFFQTLRTGNCPSVFNNGVGNCCGILLGYRRILCFGPVVPGAPGSTTLQIISYSPACFPIFLCQTDTC
jgi:hypothetical protein